MGLLDDKKYTLSLQYLEQALAVQQTFHGEGSLLEAHTWIILGRAQSESGNARAAMNSAKQANAIYVGKFGAEDQRSKDSMAKMKRYLGDAVKAVRSSRVCICPIVRGIVSS